MRNDETKKRLSIAAGLVLVLVLSACNSTDSTLGIEQPATASNAPDSTEVVPANAGAQVAALNPDAQLSNVYFAPVVGAPVKSVSALSKRLSSAAGGNSIKLESSTSPNIDHEIRGYFSALSEGGTTTVIHVWDVFTPQGQRVHRIQGQEKISGSGTEPWTNVPSSAMERIADTVLGQYASWRATS